MFVIRKNKVGEFYFELRAGNGQVIAKSYEYQTEAACLNGIYSVKLNSQSEQIKKEY